MVENADSEKENRVLQGPPENYGILRARIEGISKAIDLLAEEIRARKKISNGFKQEIEEELLRIKLALNDLAPMGRRAESRAEQIERLEMAFRTLMAKKHEQRERAWKDMFEVKREIIRLFPELNDLKMLSDLMQFIGDTSKGKNGSNGNAEKEGSGGE